MFLLFRKQVRKKYLTYGVIFVFFEILYPQKNAKYLWVYCFYLAR